MDGLQISPFSLLVGLVSHYLTSWLRKVPWFGFIDKNSKGKVHVVNGVIAAVLTVLVLFLTGQLNDASMKVVVDAVFNMLVSYSSGTSYYELGNAFAAMKVTPAPQPTE